MALIIFHELGHFITAKIFNWNVDKIYIYPLGGIVKFNDDINKPLIEELLVTLMGPIFQVILTIFLSKYEESVIEFNSFLLLFNLFPIIPLDGGRIITIICSIFKPFKKTLKIIIIISYLMYLVMLILFFKYLPIFFFIVAILLIIKIYDEGSRNIYVYNKFLLERYLRKYRIKRSVMIENIEDLYKYKNNIVNINNKLYNEQEALSLFYNGCKKM